MSEYWRTLFKRQLTPYRPVTAVIAVDESAPVATAAAAVPIVFQTLAFSSTTFARGTPSSGTILNATNGSLIVGVGLPLGLVIDSLQRTWAWDGSGSSAVSGSFTLYENIPGGSGNPHASVIGYSISAFASVIYDTRFGTDTATAASTGWFTFGLHSGSKQIFCNTNGGFSDANNGLTPATAKGSLAGAITLWLGAGFTAADQLMLAQGGAYAELTGNFNLTGKGGVSKTYPTAILSYDPADPTNVAKYGRATGSAMPVITFPSLSTGAGQCLFSVPNDDGTTHNIAVQGVELKYAGNDGNNCSAIYVGRHDGICYQNYRLNGMNVAFPNNSSSFGLSQGVNISKGSVWGQWTTSGNTEGLYFEGIDGLYFQDCALAHGGWKLGANRDDTNARGGPATLGHNYYYHATNTNGRIDRIVSIDSATDGHNVRGSATTTCLVSIDNPIAGNLTGISAAYSEAPTGSIDTCVDPLAMGGDNINAINPRGYGFRFANAAAGTSVTNGLMIDNPIYGGVNNYILQADNSNSGIVSSTVTLDKMTAYNFASTLQAVSGSFPMTITWTNSVLDELASGATNSVWNVGTFPNAKTRSQIYTAMGFASKPAIVNMMLYRPDLPWAQALISVAFPAYNKAPTYALVSPPDTTGVTPATIYSTDVTAPTLTLPTGTQTGSTTATIGATTNEANGWLYWIVSTSATAPSTYQLGQGLDSTGSAATASARQAVSATGVQSVSVTGLTASTTYHAYLMHQDAVGNRSTIASAASFTTSSGAFTPASLSPNIWVEADPTKLYTDAGTTLVTADGQAVQQANDKSANARNLSQATAGQRPLYKTGAGKPYLLFDGVDDTLTYLTNTSWTDGTGQHWIAVSCSFPTNTGLVVSITGTNVVAWVRDNAGQAGGASWNTATVVTDNNGSAMTSSTPCVLIFTVTPTASNIYLDNVGNTVALTGTRESNVAQLAVASNNGVASFANVQIYGLVQGSGLLSSTDRASLQTYMAALHP